MSPAFSSNAVSLNTEGGFEKCFGAQRISSVISAGESGTTSGPYVRLGSSGPVWQGDNGDGHLFVESAPNGAARADISATGIPINGSLTLAPMDAICDTNHAGAFNCACGALGEKGYSTSLCQRR